ncbi:ribonuclease H-like domain-containing protein [Parachaetomium inaequale]|uniref:Ribonuclease H-like domain-containing protein n=1 Tax=Parachaetomium inaequale TaxID=2588326 RepID=A0AAN6PPD3_9PEZI|nr:ribonuclease H-like domain-containing protein [Parachaetomium inaequale]
MSTRKTAHQVWHVSRGIVFAGGTSVVYPRLPAVRHHSAPAAVASEGSSIPLPPVLSMADVPAEPPAGQGPETMLGHVVATSTTTRTTTTITSTAVVGEGPIGQGQGAVIGIVEKPKSKDTTPDAVPFTPLDYKMPDKAFQAARQAPEGTPESFWNYSLYRGPGKDGALVTKVKVHYCTSVHTTERVINEHFMNEKIVGLDLEWMANAQKSYGPRKNVSLIQLASTSRIGLFHIAAFPEKGALVAPALKKLLEDPAITKVGVWIKGDCTRLSEYLKIETRGQFELSHLYRLVKFSASGEYDLINKRLVALGTQVKECLGLPLFKGDDVRTSDWTKRLSLDQIIYSSSDAYAAVQLYAVLNHQRQKLDPVPDIPHHAELNIPIPVVKPVPEVTEQDADLAAADPDPASQTAPVAEARLDVKPSVEPAIPPLNILNPVQQAPTTG